MAATRPELSCPNPSVVVLRADSRALIQRVGTTAWTVLVDVSLDACPEDAGWAAKTSVRAIADHLALAPGTVARVLGRLRAAGLVQRQDSRDRDTGRFVESVYVVLPTVAIQPCVDCPHTAELDTAAPAGPAAKPAEPDAGQRLPEGMANGSIALPKSALRPFPAATWESTSAPEQAAHNLNYRALQPLCGPP